MNKWHLIENQPLLTEIFKDPPTISYKKGKSFRKSQTMKLRSKTQQLSERGSGMACQHYEQYKLYEAKVKDTTTQPKGVVYGLSTL